MAPIFVDSSGIINCFEAVVVQRLDRGSAHRILFQAFSVRQSFRGNRCRARILLVGNFSRVDHERLYTIAAVGRKRHDCTAGSRRFAEEVRTTLGGSYRKKGDRNQIYRSGDSRATMTQFENAKEILQPGVNCWRVAKAHRATFLIDGAAYFAAFRAAVCAARRTIFCIGWDFNSRTALLRDGAIDDGLPNALGDFLNETVKRRRDLRVYVLAWDFAMLYALDREFLPLYKLGWRTHRRLHFHLDDCHPLGASQHQKIVVIDDAVAFVGGMDLTKGRWDTSEHEPDDPRRRDPDGAAYPPFHDVQIMIDGDAATAIGELARERWRAATGRQLSSARRTENDPWPSHVKPSLNEIHVGIARTKPDYGDSPAVQEVRQLYLDAIQNARRFIYLENQYFTATEIGAALSERLSERHGPEVILVTRSHGGGWLEESTMGTLRARLIAHLRGQDRYGRLRVYYPDRDGLEGQSINVHSKVMVVDDRFVRVGSANLNNRSMGFDSECDLAIESDEPRVQKAIANFRARLLAEHLGVDPSKFMDPLHESESLIHRIESCEGKKRRLKSLELDLNTSLDGLIPEASVIDWEKPVDPQKLTANLVPVEDRPGVTRRIATAVAVLLIIGGLAAAWRWTPLSESVDAKSLISAVETVRQVPAAPVWVLGAYAIVSLLAIPITVMIVATVLVFGGFLGFIYSICGSLLGASLSFWLGGLIGRDTVRRVAGTRLNKISRRLGRRGVLSVLIVRLVPVAPFTLVSLVAGASHIRFVDFAIGTVLGMMPGILTVTVFSDRLLALLRDPSSMTLAEIALVAALLIGGAAAITYGLTRRSRQRYERMS